MQALAMRARQALCVCLYGRRWRRCAYGAQAPARGTAHSGYVPGSCLAVRAQGSTPRHAGAQAMWREGAQQQACTCGAGCPVLARAGPILARSGARGAPAPGRSPPSTGPALARSAAAACSPSAAGATPAADGGSVAFALGAGKHALQGARPPRCPCAPASSACSRRRVSCLRSGRWQTGTAGRSATTVSECTCVERRRPKLGSRTTPSAVKKVTTCPSAARDA